MHLDADRAAAPAELLPAARWQSWWAAQVGPDEPLATAARQGFVVATGALAGLGVSRSATRTAIRRGTWWMPARGTVAVVRIDDADDPQQARRRHALIAAAASLRRPEHVVSCRSAAILDGLPTLRVPAFAELTAPDGSGLGNRQPAHSFGATLPASAVRSWYGVPVTDVARTLTDLARHDPRDGLMAADAALRERLVTRTAIDDAVRAATGWPGVRGARRVLALADPLAESPLESLTRLTLHDDGFPPPELQQWIAGYRVDFLFAAQRLVVEVDGRVKYTGDALWLEKVRETRLRAAGFRVERILWSDVLRHWPATSLRLRAALAGR